MAASENAAPTPSSPPSSGTSIVPTDAWTRCARPPAGSPRAIPRCSGGGTHQARLERDAAAANTRRRLAALNIGNAPLSFGRIDLEPRSDGESPGDDRFY